MQVIVETKNFDGESLSREPASVPNRADALLLAFEYFEAKQVARVTIFEDRRPANVFSTVHDPLYFVPKLDIQRRYSDRTPTIIGDSWYVN